MKMLAGNLAFLGVWVCYCAVADYVLKIEANAWAMAFGVVAFLTAKITQNWIEH